MQHEFYVTTVDEKNHEHNYRFPQGETLPEGEKLKTQKPAGLFKAADILPFGTLAALAQFRSTL